MKWLLLILALVVIIGLYHWDKRRKQPRKGDNYTLW